MNGSLVTPELEAMVGEEWPPVTYDVEATGVRAWAEAVGIDDTVYYDEVVARSRGFASLPAPPGFLGIVRRRPGDEEPGPPIRGLHPDLAKSLNGGTHIEYVAPIVSGDVLEAVSTIVSIEEKRSDSLGRMLVIDRETTFRRVGDGERVAVLRATVINY